MESSKGFDMHAYSDLPLTPVTGAPLSLPKQMIMVLFLKGYDSVLFVTILFDG